MIKKITKKGICVMACALIVFMSALSVSALEKPIAELNSTIVNNSVISTDKTYVGSTVALTAKTSVRDPDKCYYAFYSKYEDGTWMDIQTYSKKATASFTPQISGNYKLCVKIYTQSGIVYKKYFDLAVKEKLVNESIVNTDMTRPGGNVTLTGRASGGSGKYTYTYTARLDGSDSDIVLAADTTADSVSWEVQESGEYDITVTVTDSDKNTDKKSFPLSVGVSQSPSATHRLTLKAPLSTPYIWEYDFSTKAVAEVSGMKISGYDMSDASVELDYDIIGRNPGSTVLTFSCVLPDGAVHSLSYNIIVDRNMQMTVSLKDNNYITPKAPEAEQLTRDIYITVREDEVNDYEWNNISTDPNVIEVKSFDAVENGMQLTLCVKKAGHASVNMSYTYKSGTVTKYCLVYNITVSEDLSFVVDSSDGYYFRNFDLPDVSTAA